MSIIYDALKKVEILGGKKQIPAPQQKPQNKKKTALTFILLSLAALVFGALSTNLFYGLFTYFFRPRPQPTQIAPGQEEKAITEKIEIAQKQQPPQEEENPSQKNPKEETPAPEKKNLAKEIKAPGAPAQITDKIQKPLPDLTLNGVFFSENESYALINNRIVKEGDEIEGLRVARIGLNEVEIQTNGSTITLKTNIR